LRLEYGFDAALCGVAGAGANGNRTTFSDAFGGGTPTTVAYCYDNADRLTGTTVTDAPVGASAVTGGDLTTTGPGATLVYDARGNMTVLADQQLGYDITNRHESTTLTDGTVITYKRDATNRIVERKVWSPFPAAKVVGSFWVRPPTCGRGMSTPPVAFPHEFTLAVQLS
jgi:YD repeat-containing protein